MESNTTTTTRPPVGMLMTLLEQLCGSALKRLLSYTIPLQCQQQTSGAWVQVADACAQRGGDRIPGLSVTL
ncbi:hypothetical protein EYF80_007571 [Liparis tanakae]|uniref:Uncharacterized protein n=1 Tax=Liparis tanakae TaxID=230148 RepID=A0A4Z2IY77_9TELE|nr:hypothetical protein EYF80_007571 [Liparis tanakae]